MRSGCLWSPYWTLLGQLYQSRPKLTLISRKIANSLTATLHATSKVEYAEAPRASKHYARRRVMTKAMPNFSISYSAALMRRGPAARGCGQRPTGRLPGPAGPRPGSGDDGRGALNRYAHGGGWDFPRILHHHEQTRTETVSPAPVKRVRRFGAGGRQQAGCYSSAGATNSGTNSKVFRWSNSGLAWTEIARCLGTYHPYTTMANPRLSVAQTTIRT